MKTPIVIVLIALAFLIAACAQTGQPPASAQQPQPTPRPDDAAPEPPVAQDVAPDGNAKPVVTGSDKAFGQVNRTAALRAEDIQCDAATRTVAFSLTNNDNRTWDLDQTLGWNAARDKVNVQVSINSYAVNGRNQYVSGGVTYFGPGWPFSANCGGIKELAPGESATCTLQPVPLKNATGLSQGYNEIFIKTPTSDSIVQFTCG